jgi:hypothetical protein
VGDSVTGDRVSGRTSDDDAERSGEEAPAGHGSSATARYQLRRSPVRGWSQVDSSPVRTHELLVTVGDRSGLCTSNTPPNHVNKDVDNDYECP